MRSYVIFLAVPGLVASASFLPSLSETHSIEQGKVTCKTCKDPDSPAGSKVCTYCGTSLDYANFPIPTGLAITNDTNEMPCWGPSGQIAYVGFETGRDVWIMNADGSGKRKIDRKDSHADINPYWAPNGKLVFEGGVADSSIIVMEPDGSERRVVGLEGSTERQPTMRQDGAIVFLSDKGQNGDEWHNIFTMDSNGENLKKLTQDGTYNYSPCWSPDGKKIVFSTWLGENQEIQVMDADGSNLKRLTNTPKSDYDPYWAPDGRIVFVSDRDNTNGNKNELGEIYIMNADGTGQKRLTWNRWVDRNPTLDSKGRLVFQTNPTYGPLKSRGRFGIGMLQVK